MTANIHIKMNIVGDGRDGEENYELVPRRFLAFEPGGGLILVTGLFRPRALVFIGLSLVSVPPWAAPSTKVTPAPDTDPDVAVRCRRVGGACSTPVSFPWSIVAFRLPVEGPGGGGGCIANDPDGPLPVVDGGRCCGGLAEPPGT